MPSPFELQPAAFEDLDTLAEILVLANANDATISNLMRNAPHELECKFYSDEFKSVYKHEKGVKFFKVVQLESGKIVAMTCWHIPSIKTSINHWGPPPEGANEVLCDHFFGGVERLEKKWFKELGGGENLYYLYFISTLPEYQRKGIGTMAMEGMLKEADAVRKKTLVIGTPQGQYLYKKLGFEEVDNFTVDVKSHGVAGDSTWRCMVRDSKD